MRLRLQSTLVFEASTPMGARAVRALLALWRAALVSAAILVVVEAGDYMEFQESLLRPAYRVAFRAAAGLEWLPYQVGRAIPQLKAPSSVAFPCGLGRPNPIPMVPSGIAGPEGFGQPAPHWLIGNFYLVWPDFFQHMLGSTLTYFIVFLGLSELRAFWRRRRRPDGPR